MKSETINGIIYQYSYDLAGNIISIEKGTSENNLVDCRKYSYDDTGMRTTKTVNGAKSEYLYVGGQLLGEERATKFANAHEDDYLESKPESCQMDLHNNALGRQIALEYSGQGYDVFADKIQETIEEGSAVVVVEWD